MDIQLIERIQSPVTLTFSVPFSLSLFVSPLSLNTLTLSSLFLSPQAFSSNFAIRPSKHHSEGPPVHHEIVVVLAMISGTIYTPVPMNKLHLQKKRHNGENRTTCCSKILHLTKERFLPLSQFLSFSSILFPLVFFRCRSCQMRMKWEYCHLVQEL